MNFAPEESKNHIFTQAHGEFMDKGNKKSEVIIKMNEQLGEGEKKKTVIQ